MARRGRRQESHYGPQGRSSGAFYSPPSSPDDGLRTVYLPDPPSFFPRSDEVISIPSAPFGRDRVTDEVLSWVARPSLRPRVYYSPVSHKYPSPASQDRYSAFREWSRGVGTTRGRSTPLRVPSAVWFCLKRKQRRQVLFARRVAGWRRKRSPGRGGSYRRTPNSAYRC